MSGAEKNLRIDKVFGDVNLTNSDEYRVGSAINELLSCLTETPTPFSRKLRKPPADAIVKIKHNNLKKTKYIIKQYTEYSSLIEDAYLELDKAIPFAKHTILENLNNSYYKALDHYEVEYLLEDIDIAEIREKSDFIITYIIKDLKDTVFHSKNTPSLHEHIETGVNVVVAHAFIECVIMEKP